MANNSEYGPILYEGLRIAYGVKNARQLAIKLGISDVSIGAWKKGESAPEMHRLLKAREELGVSIDWLFTREEPMMIADAKAAAANHKLAINTLSPNKENLKTAYDCVATGLATLAEEIDRSSAVEEQRKDA